MEHGGSLASLILVVTISFLIPVVLYQLRLSLLPVVVAEIIVGLVIGKSGFNLIGDDPWLSLLSLLGFIYLMFLSGVEIDFNAFRRKTAGAGHTASPLAAAIIIFAAIFLVSGLLSLGLKAAGLVDQLFLMTLIIGTISLGVVVPVLKEKKLLDKPLGQILLLVTVLADFATMILLAFYVSWLDRSVARMALLLLFFIVIYLIYRFIRRFAAKKWFQVLSQGTTQFGTRASFALILLFVFLSETMGAENILGAFLAGVVVSVLGPNKQFVRQLESFGYGFLIPIFFVMVGVKLELRSLFNEPRVLLLIPLLLLCMFVSKMIPMLYLKPWFGWRITIGSGVLLSSTLSLVIAAATLAQELGIIDEALHGSLILVAVLSCLCFPVLFNKLMPKEAKTKTVISIIGVNHISMSAAQELMKEPDYEVRLYTTEGAEDAGERPEELPVRERAVQLRQVRHFSEPELEQGGAFGADLVVLATTEDETNIRLARSLAQDANQRLIVRVEHPERQRELQQEGFTVFSTLFAAKTVLRALIENPSALKLIAEQDDLMHEVAVDSPAFEGVMLRELPMLSELLILRIYRGESFVIPNGSTVIQTGDRLLVSGDAERVQAFKHRLQ